jgi:hypothetical protein
VSQLNHLFCNFKMSEPVILYSSCQITQEVLSKFLLSLGFTLTPKDTFLGQLCRDRNSCVWVGFDNTILENLESDEDQLIANQLGEVPKTCVVVEISSTSPDDSLAIEFAIAFVQQWKAVASYDCPEKIYQLEDLLNLRDSGKVFL